MERLSSKKEKEDSWGKQSHLKTEGANLNDGGGQRQEMYGHCVKHLPTCECHVLVYMGVHKYFGVHMEVKANLGCHASEAMHPVLKFTFI